MLQLKVVMFIEMTVIVLCGIARIFIPFDFIQITLVTMAIAVGLIMLVIIVIPALEWLLKL